MALSGLYAGMLQQAAHQGREGRHRRRSTAILIRRSLGRSWQVAHQNPGPAVDEEGRDGQAGVQLAGTVGQG